VESSGIPKSSELKAFLEQPLPSGGIPVSIDILIPHAFASSFHHRVLHSLDNAIVAPMLLPEFTSCSGTEMKRQRHWDFFFCGFLELALQSGYHYVFDRNATSSSYSGIVPNLKPDFLVIVNGKALFFGEEKKSEKDLDTAEQELTDKLHWSPFTLGDKLPYILGYATGGTRVRLSALTNNGIRHAISDVLDITQAEHRFWLTRAIVNIIRLLPRLSELVPAETIPIGRTVQRLNGVQLIFSAQSLVKVVPKEDRHIDFPHLQEFYSTILPQLPHSIRCDLINSSWNDGAKLHLSPIGKAVRDPEPDMRVVVEALRCVLVALDKLHDLGWCHRDVRWKNILQVEDGTFMLIDFEYAAMEGRRITWSNNHLPPEVKRDQNMAWGKSQDMWQVGRLLLGVLGQRDDFSQLHMLLSREDPAFRMSAKDALQHPLIGTRSPNATEG